jgi:hypothetical protein
VAPAAEIALHRLAVMEAGIVTDDMDFPVTPPAAAQLVEMADEQSRRAVLFGEPDGHEQRAAPPVERARQVVFLVGAGPGEFDVGAPAHPHGPDFGVGSDIDLVLAYRELAGRQ